MSDYIKAWQCIGCGRIEAPQTCLGICQDRKVELVYADEHEQTEAALAKARQRNDALESLIRRLAYTRPREGQWERSYLDMQARARALLGRLTSV
jgi:hypothetical protein